MKLQLGSSLAGYRFLSARGKLDLHRHPQVRRTMVMGWSLGHPWSASKWNRSQQLLLLCHQVSPTTRIFLCYIRCLALVPTSRVHGINKRSEFICKMGAARTLYIQDMIHMWILCVRNILSLKTWISPFVLIVIVIVIDSWSYSKSQP